MTTYQPRTLKTNQLHDASRHRKHLTSLSAQRLWGGQHWVCASLGRSAPLPRTSYHRTEG
eukprot:scaffold33198_cov54-Phaeocystis_antarctica.AAC.3